MAAQAALIASTIAGMKKVTHGIQHASDSDDGPTSLVTNRGHKLKRRAQYIHEGQLDGQRPYKKRIEHAGYHRFILTRNPQRYDAWGDELDVDELDEEADQEAAETYPYSEVHIESMATLLSEFTNRAAIALLRPLTDPTQLPTHPTLSIPYKSPILPDMVEQASEILHRERKTLWSIKHLLISFRGDASWIPGEAVWSENDSALFPIDGIREEIIGASKSPLIYETITVESPQEDRKRGTQAPEDKAGLDVKSKLDLDSSSIKKGRTVQGDMPTKPNAAAQATEDLVASPLAAQEIVKTTDTTHTEEPGRASSELLHPSALLEPDPESRASITSDHHEGPRPEPASDDLPASTKVETNEPDADDDGQTLPRRMTTRAQALATSDAGLSTQTRSPSPTSSLPNYIHPLYTIPPSAIPDRDLGLAANEAEDIRRLLMAWVQKQEEVCRGAERFYESLTNANSMRQTVFAWCKAEGHVGEMSDGEDWYDMEEWGLSEELRKGQMEEEDEVTTAGKKTRGRRAAA